MVQHSLTRITDDIDGTPDAETITFSVMGKLYEIDLGEQNAAKLLAALEPFIDHARRPGAPARYLTKGRKTPTRGT